MADNTHEEHSVNPINIQSENPWTILIPLKTWGQLTQIKNLQIWIYIGTLDEGVVRYDVKTLNCFSNPDGFINQTVFAIGFVGQDAASEVHHCRNTSVRRNSNSS